MTMKHQRLLLTPKAFSPLGTVQLSSEIARLVDPNPDFDLLDIRFELEEIEAKYAAKLGTSSYSLDAAAPTPAGAKCFGGNVSDVADFGRGGFCMRLSDLELYSDNSDEDAKENVGQPEVSTSNGRQQRRNFTLPRGVDVERPQPDWVTSSLLPKPDKVETTLQEVNRKRENIRQTKLSFEEKVREEQRQAAARCAQVEKDKVVMSEKAQRNDKQDRPSMLQPDWVRSPLLPKTDEVETALREVNRERLLKVQEEIRQTQVSFDEKFREEQRQAAARLAQVEKDKVVRCEKARRNDKQDQRSIAEARDQHLSVIQHDHEQRSQVEERAIRKEVAAEEARRREHERVREQQRRARDEAEVRRKAEAERQKAAEEDAKRKAEAEAAKRKAQADAAAAAAIKRAAALQQLDLERKAKLEAQQKAIVLARNEAAKAIVTVPVPKPRISELAAKLEEPKLSKLEELQGSYKHLATDPALKKEWKVYERQLTKHLAQVAATQEHVRTKSADLIRLLKSPNGPPVQFLIVTFGAKLLSQCEVQVRQVASYAFALAQVVANVNSQVPFVMESVVAQLHQVCIFTVPKYYVFSKNQFENDEAYYSALGYKEEGGKLESTDNYVARMNAYITFYAALTQTEGQAGVTPLGLKHAWSWCACLLNTIPANRLSASALGAFLKTAGYQLHRTYPTPFSKLMRTVVSQYLVTLKNHDDADVIAAVYQLETYIVLEQFKTPPNGQNMPLRDISGDLKA